MKLGTFLSRFLARIVTSLMLLVFFASVANAQGPVLRDAGASSTSSISSILGKWSYRSFHSNPDLNAEPKSLLFGSGTMDLSVTTPDNLTGTLGGTGWQLTLTGKVTSGEPTSIRFTGKGIVEGEEWVYDYLGYAIPAWPDGVDQRPAIVGTIVRTKAHTGGAAKAGVVAQWIAVKQDPSTAPPPLSVNSTDRALRAESEAQLEELESKWATAVATNDPEQIGKFFTNDFLFVGAGGVLQTRQEHLDDFQSGKLKVESVRIDDFKANVYDLFAVVNTLVSVKGKLGDRDISGAYRFMDTFQVQGIQWLAVARQQTRVAVSSLTTPVEVTVDSENYRFTVDGVNNPPIKVKQGSLVKISLTSRQGSHDWVLATTQGTVLARTARVSAGQPAVTVEFTASDVGQFSYYCSVGSHRTQGMEGAFIVESVPAEGERTKAQPKSLQRARGLPSDKVLRQRYLREDPLSGSRNDLRVLNAATDSDSVIDSRLLATASEISSAGGRLDVTLDVAYGTATIGNDAVRLRMYNQKLVGPTLRVKAGDVMYITLNNRLPSETATGHAVNGHHDWNTTNLHFHGLHVAPQGPAGVPDAESDNVLISIPPSDPFDPTKSTQKYRVQIPADHVAGTFWYHAHKHGSTTAQVSSGMAGALIVERTDAVHNLDSVAEISAAREEVLVLQEIPYLKDTASSPGEIERSPVTSSDPNENDVRMFSPGSFRDLRRYITVNGEKIPTITMAPGEVRRLRLIHTGQRENVRLRVERAPGTTAGPEYLSLHEVAVDGLPTGSIRETGPTQPDLRDRVLELFPGYRSDVLLKAPSVAADYYLVDTRNDVTVGGVLVPRPDTGADLSPELLRWVTRIRVEGTSVSMSLPSPASLSSHRLGDLSPAAVTNTRHSFYGLELNLTPIGYFISRVDLSTSNSPVSFANAKSYDPLDPQRVPLGATERWLVGSRNNGAAVTHPFHIHVNPFLIKSVTSLVEPGSVGVPKDVTSREIGSPTWRDTLAMKHGYTYELLTRYDDFTGDFVDHCHILDHEDNGMMEKVSIFDPSIPHPVLPTPLGQLSKGDRNIGSGKPSVMFFVKGSFCPHCMAQLTEMATFLSEKDADVTVVTASTKEDIEAFPKVPFRIESDPELKLFRQHGAFDGEAKHATIVRDRKGNEALRRVGDEPFMDSKLVLASLKRASPQVVIAVRNTDDTKDDYLTWAATPCQIRIANGVSGDEDLTVSLTNDPDGTRPDAGDVRFAATMAPGKTAKDESITLVLKQDGTPVDFFMAGFKASNLTVSSMANGGRDAFVEVHQGSAIGPLLSDNTAVMVRVRKDFATMNDLERDEFLKAFAALRNMSDVTKDRFEPLVRLHKLAAMGRRPGYDQAHMSSGFLPWHRAFLLLLEREMQKSHPHVALPYWRMDIRPSHFAPQYLGNNVNPVSGPQSEVIFAPSNPLYGWNVRFDSLGNLVRAEGDHVTISTNAHYQSGSALETSSSGVYRSFRRLLEDDPHNVGHNNTGEWMAACVSSPADPVFWIFHCHHDHLWAHWQWNFNRFQTNGDSPDHYFPDNAYSSMDPIADRKNFPLGHHLKDTMWPWDESHGQQVAMDPYTTRPAEALSRFPKSSVDFVWPTRAESPTPGDMIDYWGLVAGTLSHGFAYDDTPFGPKENPPVNIVVQNTDGQGIHREVFLDSGASESNRLKAAAGMELHDTLSQAAFEAVLTDAKTSPAVKAKALSLMGKGAPDRAVNQAILLLDSKATDAFLSHSAISELLRLHHIGELSEESRELIHETIKQLANDEDRPSIRAEAVDGLAQMSDPAAQPILEQMLRSPESAPLPLRRVVYLCRRYPQTFELIRPLLESRQDELVTASLQALGNDPASTLARIRLLESRERTPSVRQAAVRSIMSSVPSALEPLMRVGLDPSELDETRAEAIAGIRVLVQRFKSDLGAEQLRDVAKALASSNAVMTSELGKTILLTQEAIQEVLQ